MDHTGGHTEADTEAYWSMYNGGSGVSNKIDGVTDNTSRVNSPVMGKYRNRFISRKLEALHDMQCMIEKKCYMHIYTCPTGINYH